MEHRYGRPLTEDFFLLDVTIILIALDFRLKKRINIRKPSGMVVMHKKFGKGTISSIDKAGKHLKVSFTEGGEKAFIYPDAFVQGFLTLDKGE